VVRIRQITLKWRGLDCVDRQDRNENRMAAEWFFVRTYYASTDLLNCRRNFGGSSWRLVQAALRRLETLCPRLCFPWALLWWGALDHTELSF